MLPENHTNFSFEYVSLPVLLANEKCCQISCCLSATDTKIMNEGDEDHICCSLLSKSTSRREWKITMPGQCGNLDIHNNHRFVRNDLLACESGRLV